MTMSTTVKVLIVEAASAPTLGVGGGGGPDPQSLPLKPLLQEHAQFGSQPLTSYAFPLQSKLFEQGSVPCCWQPCDATSCEVTQLHKAARSTACAARIGPILLRRKAETARIRHAWEGVVLLRFFFLASRQHLRLARFPTKRKTTTVVE